MYEVTVYPSNKHSQTYIGPKAYVVRKREEAILAGWGCSGIRKAS